MKKITLMLVVLFSGAVSSAAQQKAPIQEVRHTTATAAAPRECLVTFREFFAYLQRDESNIVRDEQAQKRFLSEQLRKAFMEKVATFSNPQDDPDYPSNRTFIGAWDKPSTYAIVSSRRYGKRAIVDVLYKWGPKTNYPGDERTMSFIFILEEGRWKLEDVYTFRGEFAQAESLNQYLREK